MVAAAVAAAAWSGRRKIAAAAADSAMAPIFFSVALIQSDFKLWIRVRRPMMMMIVFIGMPSHNKALVGLADLLKGCRLVGSSS